MQGPSASVAGPANMIGASTGTPVSRMGSSGKSAQRPVQRMGTSVSASRPASSPPSAGTPAVPGAAASASPAPAAPVVPPVPALPVAGGVLLTFAQPSAIANATQ